MRAIAASLALFAFAGCTDKALPLAPEPSTALANVADLSDLIDDVRARLEPTLPDAPARGGVHDALVGLSQSLAEGEARLVAVALDRADASLGQYERAIVADDEVTAILDAMYLAFDAIEAQLTIARAAQ